MGDPGSVEIMVAGADSRREALSAITWHDPSFADNFADSLARLLPQERQKRPAQAVGVGAVMVALDCLDAVGSIDPELGAELTKVVHRSWLEISKAVCVEPADAMHVLAVTKAFLDGRSIATMLPEDGPAPMFGL